MPAIRAIKATKRCVLCGETKPREDFSAYAYTTRQGKRSVRLEARCLSCNRDRRMARYRENPKRDQESTREWRSENAEHMRAYRKRRQADPAHRANKAKSQRLRKARLRSGSPDTPEIRAIYSEAMRLETVIAKCPVFDLPELGKKLHVDHVHPLARGGKHVAENLQILPAGLNLRKWAHA